MNRRDFLAGSGLAATSLAVTLACSPIPEAQRRLDRIGIQLYTVREQMAADATATLERIARIGYDEVEFAGYHDHAPQRLRKLLDDLGINAPSAHISLDGMRSNAAQLIEDARIMGHEYLVLGWLAPPDRETLDHYRRHAELCNRFGEQCRAAGVQFAYHNHEFEFETLEGERPMDLLLAETDADLVKMELDLYWISYAGADPFEYFSRHPGRYPLCHVKDMAADRRMADVGAGTIDFAKIFAAGDRAGLEHYFVERDDSPDPMATAAASFSAVRNLTF